MEILLSILQDVFKAIASKAVLQGLAILATALLLGWLQPWWGRRSARGKMSVGIGGFVVLVALIVGVYFETKPDRAAIPFAILVADLDGDADKTQTHHILQSLRSQFGDAIAHGDIEILSRGEALAVPPGNIRTAESETTEKARAWLKEQNASVLVWGEVAARDKLLRLRFLPAEAEGSAKSYALSEQTLELPNDFGGDLGGLFAAQAANAIAPVRDRSGEALANLLVPLVASLKPLAENPPESFSDEARAQFWNAYAAGECRLGEERGDNARIVTAIEFYRKALTIWTRERVPLDWAMTENSLGHAMQKLGERESGTAHLEEAVAAFREALQERSRERVPLDWAATQNNLGTAIQRLGERESGTAHLEEAAAVFREALEEFTRERAPLQWATTQNNLGNALLRLGKREGRTAPLEEAVAAHREALKERTRERAPLDWAATQNNLGAALSRLGEQESGTGHLEQAVAAYREALKELTRERVPLEWATAQNNLGVALENLGERESGTARFEEAVVAYRDVLKERTRERVPLEWAATQNNLGAALQRLGEREAQTDKAKAAETLKAALDHYVGALEESRKAGASYYEEVARSNIAELAARFSVKNVAE